MCKYRPPEAGRGRFLLSPLLIFPNKRDPNEPSLFALRLPGCPSAAAALAVAAADIVQFVVGRRRRTRLSSQVADQAPEDDLPLQGDIMIITCDGRSMD